MGRLGLSGTGKLPGQMGDCGVLQCEVPQPGVQLAVDGCIMVMKRDEMNLIFRGGRCLTLTLTHTHNTFKNGRMDYALKRLLVINIIQHGAISAVSPLLNISREIVRNSEE